MASFTPEEKEQFLQIINLAVDIPVKTEGLSFKEWSDKFFEMTSIVFPTYQLDIAYTFLKSKGL